MAEIAPAELDRRLRSEAADPVVLDVRHADDFDVRHLPGSENVGVHDELKDDPDAAVEQLRTLPRDREIVTVCAVGKLSAVVETDRHRDGTARGVRLDGRFVAHGAMAGVRSRETRSGRGCGVMGSTA